MATKPMTQKDAQTMTPVISISGIGPSLAAVLISKGIESAEKFAATPIADLVSIPGIGARSAEKLLTAASQALLVKPAVEATQPLPVRAKKGSKSEKKAAKKKAKKKEKPTAKKASVKKAKKKKAGKSNKESKGKKNRKAKKK